MSDDLTHYMEATAQLHKENEILATAVEMNGRRVAELEAENARLRAVVEAESEFIRQRDAFRDENDRLRAVKADDDRLVAALNLTIEGLEAENERLRAVAKAALMFLTAWEARDITHEPDHLRDTLGQLDVSEDMGRETTPCEWCRGSGRKFLTDDELDNLCGSPANNGPCILPRGHNMGQVDIPEKHWSGRSQMPDDAKRYFADRAERAGAAPEEDPYTDDERAAILAMQLRTETWQNAAGPGDPPTSAPEDSDA